MIYFQIGSWDEWKAFFRKRCIWLRLLSTTTNEPFVRCLVNALVWSGGTFVAFKVPEKDAIEEQSLLGFTGGTMSACYRIHLSESLAQTEYNPKVVFLYARYCPSSYTTDRGHPIMQWFRSVHVSAKLHAGA